MSAVQEFLESEWKENERIITKEKKLRDLQSKLDEALTQMADAKMRMVTAKRKMPTRDGFHRVGTFIGCLYLWRFILVILIDLPFKGITGKVPDAPLGISLVVIAVVLGWFTPRIVFEVREHSRVHAIRSKAQSEHTRFERTVEDLRVKIGAVSAQM